MSAAIECSELTKTYQLGFWMNRSVQALKGLSLSIPEGQVFGLLGPNGAGKSTTIKILMDLVQASSGTASILGVDSRTRDARRLVGFVPENPMPYEYLTGQEFVELSAQLAGLKGAAVKKRSSEVIEAVGMGKAQKLQIRRYSKGMVQRLTLAQALVSEPRVLILDEPTSGLDPLGRRQMRELILAEKKKSTTILFCTHIIADAEMLCDRLAVIIGGKMVKAGTVAELLADQSPHFEMLTEGFGLQNAQPLQADGVTLREIGGRLELLVPDTQVDNILKSVLDKGGRVVRLQPSKFTLEDMFVQAVEQSQSNKVGGEMQL